MDGSYTFQEPKKLLFKHILAAVVQATQVAEREILGNRRIRYIKNARWMVIWLVRKHKGYSYPEIARLLQMGDHTSVLYAEKRFLDQVRQFPELEDMLDTAESLISQIPGIQPEGEVPA